MSPRELYLIYKFKRFGTEEPMTPARLQELIQADKTQGGVEGGKRD